jgi:hypothetical protein
VHENNTFKVTNTGTLTYEVRQNTDFSSHGCVDEAENTLENLQTETARDNVSEPHAYIMAYDSKGTKSSTEEDVVLNTQVFTFCSEY